jgi:ammonia channel protein AmtB
MKKPLPILFTVLGVLFLAIAIYYWVTPAGSLAHWAPGYSAGSTHVHMKHGLAALVLAIGSGILVWFTSNNKKTSA